MGGHAKLSLLSLLLLACVEDDGAEKEGGLPRAVALVVERTDGSAVSVYFAVQPNARDRIDVRATDGVVLPGPRGVHALADAGEGRWRLLEEVRSTTEVLPLPAGPPWTLQRLQTRRAWFAAPGAPDQLCEFPAPRCAPAPTLPPVLSLRRAGPGGGFRLGLDEGRLAFWPPHLPDSADGEPILEGVRGLLAVRWLEGQPTAAVLEYLDRSFRGVGRLEAVEGEVKVDGELEEWRTAVPDVVDSPWQAAVRRSWTGPDDASFSVAARRTPAQLCFAGRFRDDQLGEGDELIMQLGESQWTLPLATGRDADGFVVRRERYGYRFELCRPAPNGSGALPFAALFQDVDGTDAPDILSTAPIFAGVPAGTLKLSERPG